MTRPEDIAAYVAALPHAEAVEVLRALLRAAPDAAVEAVDTCKVARGWSNHGENEVRLPLGRSTFLHTAFAGPLGTRGPYAKGEWMFGRPDGWGPDGWGRGRALTGQEARDASDRAWAADGWVFAGGAR